MRNRFGQRKLDIQNILILVRNVIFFLFLLLFTNSFLKRSYDVSLLRITLKILKSCVLAHFRSFSAVRSIVPQKSLWTHYCSNTPTNTSAAQKDLVNCFYGIKLSFTDHITGSRCSRSRRIETSMFSKHDTVAVPQCHWSHQSDGWVTPELLR